MSATFSYAQAAKGVAAPSSATKPLPDSPAEAKEATNVSTQDANASARSWAEDVEIESRPNPPTQSREPRSQSSGSNIGRVSRSVDTSSVSSPDLGASSSSTVTKDDDVSSIPNTSSESTWDNKSQASTSVEKPAEPAEKTAEKVKKGKNAIVKPLQEAPPPAVNIWKMRADEQKAKIKHNPALTTNGVPTPTTNSMKRSDLVAQDKIGVESRSRARDDANSGRKDFRGDTDARKGVKGRVSEKDTKASAGVLPPPPNRDQESWPTPDIAIDEDRKKAQEKVEKPEKDRKDGAASGKHEWVKVPYTPSVVFNTPLPNAANARRGGRPGGRGGAQNSGRPSGSPSNGARHTDKEGSEADPAPNGEQAKRERHDGALAHDVSPKAKRNGVVTSTLNPEAPAMNGDANPKSVGPATSDADSQAKGTPDSGTFPGHSSLNSRPFAGRSNKARRADFSGAGERRRDDGSSPTKDNTFDDRRASVPVQSEVTADGERRAAFHHDGPNGNHSKQGRYPSFPGGRGERGRGGRGTRSSYPNGHQYMNGHHSVQSSSTFPMGPRSPTVLNSENGSFFPQPQGKYSRNAHRSQSVTATDPYRFPPYQNGPTAPMPGYPLYEYNMMSPISPVPFTNYVVDHYALFNMITTQVEYYFSIDNLLKDMYLRRHMDSQGFVSLEFIAGFNRIKTLSSDLELIKLVCQQSADIEYRTSEHGQDRLRRRDGWAQWVLKMDERDESARNEGPKELHQPPVPRPAGFEQPAPFHNPYSSADAFNQTNGSLGVSQDATVPSTIDLQSATTKVPESAVNSTDRPMEESIKAHDGGPPTRCHESARTDFFSDSTKAKTKMTLFFHTPLTLHMNYTTGPGRELQQRQDVDLGTLRRNMNALHQFRWLFSIQNFNTRMYDKFRQFTLEDSFGTKIDVGLSYLIEYYGEYLLSPHSMIRQCVASDFVEPVHRAIRYVSSSSIGSMTISLAR
ncbi:hypothetical protein LEMA_P050810.1 [Plenodomus lingam JN3]|uniref:HTH La-type RNA-binding domain-containing protein n=1 Tax=Leptosphaeria maculans (strain JN3 / isolate v23.1.3 / race Av1-4-5-6-7-8) TaxID=985895 RepID=E4ZM26_LEPMJ|nr:hypothetical protein LEMA_P050810.1 [Plenodomus lingam JN3]CBX92375.1 hypothetical protein LEMA_P050810.1 [Plenodomus lingam JN3]